MAHRGRNFSEFWARAARRLRFFCEKSGAGQWIRAIMARKRMFRSVFRSHHWRFFE